LRPVSRVMAQELLAGDYLQADETPVGVQMHDDRGQNHQGYLWQYSRPGDSLKRAASSSISSFGFGLPDSDFFRYKGAYD
jgi:Transposase IS66 family